MRTRTPHRHTQPTRKTTAHGSSVYDPSTKEAEAGGMQVRGQPVLFGEEGWEKEKHGKEDGNGEERGIQKTREGKGAEQRRRNRKEEQRVNELETSC